MRRLFYLLGRGVLAGSLILTLSLSASTRPREDRPREPRAKRQPIVKIVKKLIQSLGDGLVTPTP